MPIKARTVDEYLSLVNETQRTALEKLRRDIRAAAPKAEECISYHMPAFRLDGKLLVAYAAATKHCAFHAGAHPVKALGGELAGYSTSKGSIRFRPEQPLPTALVRKLVKTRLAERAATRAPAAPRTAVEPEAQLAQFIDKFDAARQTLIRGVRRAMRKRFPTANELVYDNYNFFVIGYGPNERPSDAIFSIAAGANGVSLCFLDGARLSDPTKRLLGDGKQTRFVRLDSAAVLDQPDVDALLEAAVAAADPTFAPTGRGTLIIRSVSAKQRPRRKNVH